MWFKKKVEFFKILAKHPSPRVCLLNAGRIIHNWNRQYLTETFLRFKFWGDNNRFSHNHLLQSEVILNRKRLYLIF